ncbi:MAG TPA: prepilin-type N-terminal cleavage/methylation domain-containing protein [Candidatus Acidoferrales bacterium]|nr:prepilin-type N-terminal cleavage/methylation domain-containing protein [Candidatus Acidoferrales bacterium]
MNQLRVRHDGGFTLIELLVVIAIIGILAAIAIPQFSAYRRRGYDSQAKSDLRNAATAQEAYFTDNNAYTSTVSSLTGTYGYRQSANLTVAATGTSTTFVVTATVASGCASGTGVWSFASASGVITGTPCG